MKNYLTDDIDGYNQKRNFVSLPHTNITFKERFNVFKLPNAIYFRLLKQSKKFFLFSHFSFKEENSIYHFFNTISFGKTPWVVSFETSLPRWGKGPHWLNKLGVKLLANPNCRKIIALSECAKNIQESYLEEFADYKTAIMDKLVVLHPAQELLISNYEEKELDTDNIVFTLIGNDFFRKGGKEILQAFNQALDDKMNIKLNIISNFQYGDYATQTTIADLDEAYSIIEMHPDRIIVQNNLSNTEVLEVLKKTHVGLLPTWADTYGYSVLEAQAAGCPVISTNIRALSEINNNNIGWVIDVKKDKFGNATLTSKNERDSLSNTIEKGLIAALRDIYNNPAQIPLKGKLCLMKIKEEHDPTALAKALTKIYQDA